MVFIEGLLKISDYVAFATDKSKTKVNISHHLFSFSMDEPDQENIAAGLNVFWMTSVLSKVNGFSPFLYFT